MKDDRFYLTHIIECAERIEGYTRSGRDAFMQSEMIQDAVVRNFEIIGEATKQVSQDLKDSHPGVPWRRIAGFRDVLIHGYFTIDLNEVWNVVGRDLADLKSKIESILQQLQHKA